LAPGVAVGQPDPVADPRDLLELAVAAATGAADLLRTSRPDPEAIVTKSSSTDLVTDLDRAAEARIIDVLLGARPDDGVFGEEGGRRTGSSGVRWIIDPLDGTTNYVYGYPVYAVSIAAEADGAVVAGTVVDITRSERYTAALGHGAHLDGDALHVSAATDLATALLGTGFSYDAATRAAQALVLTAVLPAVRDLRRSGSAALDLCALAAGRLDGFWERGLAPWDRAAGSLIAAEAGARVGRLGTTEPLTLLAAPPGLYDGLEALLDAAGAGL
jgi:myo-inositol-1(or 4)-monophosphatase